MKTTILITACLITAVITVSIVLCIMVLVEQRRQYKLVLKLYNYTRELEKRIDDAVEYIGDSDYLLSTKQLLKILKGED